MSLSQPSHDREDLRYGDPHLNRGKHPFYGPDKFALREAGKPDEEEKPTMESHGFYMAHETGERRSVWERIKMFFVGDRLP